jgi:hypothetical protein
MVLQNQRRALVDYSPEKAGVGGSTPSLATTFQSTYSESRLALPVRSQSAFARGSGSRCRIGMAVKNLGAVAFLLVRFQSALIRGMTENRIQHFSRCDPAILADSVAVELERQFDIAVAEQGLNGLRIGSDANEERRQAVPKIMEAKPAWIILHHSPVFVPMR